MVQIAKSGLGSSSPLDQLQTPDDLHAAPSANTSQTRELGSNSGSSPANDETSYVLARTVQATTKTSHADRPSSHRLVPWSLNLLDQLHKGTDEALAVSSVFLKGAHLVIKHCPHDQKMIRGICVAVLKKAAPWVSRTEKASDAYDLLRIFRDNVVQTQHQWEQILKGNERLSAKVAKLGPVLAAVSFSAVANFTLETARGSVGLIRTGAGMLGADVAHPMPTCSPYVSFGSTRLLNPRVYWSWQFLDYVNYKAATVYDVDNVYLYIHTRVDRFDRSHR